MVKVSVGCGDRGIGRPSSLARAEGKIEVFAGCQPVAKMMRSEEIVAPEVRFTVLFLADAMEVRMTRTCFPSSTMRMKFLSFSWRSDKPPECQNRLRMLVIADLNHLEKLTYLSSARVVCRFHSSYICLLMHFGSHSSRTTERTRFRKRSHTVPSVRNLCSISNIPQA